MLSFIGSALKEQKVCITFKEGEIIERQWIKDFLKLKTGKKRRGRNKEEPKNRKYKLR